jgi:hypothetical protein
VAAYADQISLGAMDTLEADSLSNPKLPELMRRLQYPALLERATRVQLLKISESRSRSRPDTRKIYDMTIMVGIDARKNRSSFDLNYDDPDHVSHLVDSRWLQPDHHRIRSAQSILPEMHWTST